MSLNQNNSVFFEGALASDPKLNIFNKTDRESGEEREEAVCRFTLALNGGKDGNSKETCFIPCEIWSSAADLIGEYKKGDVIAGWGILRNNKWKDKTTGEERRELVVRVSRFYEVSIKSRDRDNEYQEAGFKVSPY